MVPLEPSSPFSFGLIFIEFLGSFWRSTDSSWRLAHLQGVMVSVGPSSLRSDLVEPTKDDPEMLQREALNFNAINQCRHLHQETRKCGNMIFWQNNTLAKNILAKQNFWKHDVLAKWHFGKPILWQNDILAKWYPRIIHIGPFSKINTAFKANNFANLFTK